MKKFRLPHFDWIDISIIFVITLSVFTLGLSLKNKNTFNLTTTPKELNSPERVLAFEDELLTEIYNLRIQHPYIVFAQAVLETGNFTSDVFKENNNLFGMKLPASRPTTAIKANKGHAVYQNWRECLIDYAIWQSIYARNLSEEEYFNKLRAIYAQDIQYIEKVNKIKNNVTK